MRQPVRSLPPPAAEEAATGQVPENSPDTGEDLVVTGYRASLASALAAKRADIRVTDGISAEDIGKFPSENIAEAIQRISGVQMQNVNGRGATISVRGLGPQYARTTINGQTFKSADFTDGFRYDIIQTDLATSIQVIKSPIANMDAGGLSGTVNIDMLKPLDYRDPRLVLSVKGQKSQLADGGVTPKISASYLGQFVSGTLGVFVNAGYQKLKDRADYLFMDRWFTTTTSAGVLYTPRRPRFRRIDRDTERLLFNGGVQWKPSNRLEIFATGLYAQDKTNYDVNQQVFLFDQSRLTTQAITGLTATQITANRFTLENNRQEETRNLSSQAYTISGKWNDGAGWTVKAIGNYTRGKSYQREDAAILGVTIASATLDITDPKNVKFATSNDLSSAALYDPTTMVRNEYPNGATRTLSSTEKSAQVDVNRELGWGPLASIDVGAKYANETFDRYVSRHDRAVIGNARPSALPNLANDSYTVTDFLHGKQSVTSSWIAPDLGSYRAALAREGVTVPELWAPEASYGVDRYIPSVYGMANFSSEVFTLPVRGNIGVRYEHTRQVVNGNLTRDVPGQEVDAATGTFRDTNKYGNILPSATLVVDVARGLLVRGAVAKVLVRPILDSNTSLAQISSSSVGTDGITTNTIALGQSNLKPLTAKQADLGVEWYYDGTNGITLAGFWKDVKNGTFSSLVCPGSFNGVTLSRNGIGECASAAGQYYDITQTLNDANVVTIKGYEIGVTQSFDRFLPVKGFGVMANYTRVSPEDTGTAGFRIRNLSKQTWNVTGYWEDRMFSLRASVNHRSSYYQDSTDSFFAREGHTIRPRTQLDVALGLEVSERLNFAAGALNLTNATEEAYKDLPERWQMTSVTGRSFYLTASVRM
jgi:TonB-dependent receptor